MHLTNFTRSVFALAISASLAGTAAADTYSQNFDGFVDGSTDLGDGSVMAGTTRIQSDQLELTTDGVAGGFASFSVPALANSSAGFTASFDLTISDGAAANEPADGMSFNYGDAALGELGSAEEGMAGVGTVVENLSFEIDTWMNLDAEQGVNIAEKVGGIDTNLAFTNGSILADGTSVSGLVTLSWNPTDGASYTTTGLLTNAAFTNVATTFVPDDGHTFIISARVGGANETLQIDNLVIETGTPTDTDGDGLSDVYENANGLDPDDNGLNPNNNGIVGDPDQGADGDPDMDNLTNAEERDSGTDPQDEDSDDDGLLDGVEDGSGTWTNTGATGTQPLIDDTDGDGLLDGVENPDLPYDPGNPTTQPGTDPNITDTDADGVNDGSEVDMGRDPTVPQVIVLNGAYAQSFDGFDNGTTDLGDGTVMSGTANVQNSKLEMTRDGVAGGFASFSIPAIPGSSSGWTATFDLEISDGPGANEPADGMSLNYGDAMLGELGSAEEGMAGVGSVTENLSFEIDTWMNLDAEQGVNIAEKVAGADVNLAFTNGSILADGTSVSGPVVMSWDPVDGASFTTEGLLTNADFENVVTSFTADDTHNFIISARVGGANETLTIDNLVINLGSGGPMIKFTEIIVTPGAGAADPILVDLTWTSVSERLYKIERSETLGVGAAWQELDDGLPSGGDFTEFSDVLPAGTGKMYYRASDAGSAGGG